MDTLRQVVRLLQTEVGACRHGRLRDRGSVHLGGDRPGIQEGHLSRVGEAERQGYKAILTTGRTKETSHP